MGIFRKYRPKSRILKIFDKNRDFCKIRQISRFYENFEQNQDLSEIFTKIEIFKKSRILSKFFLKIANLVDIFERSLF